MYANVILNLKKHTFIIALENMESRTWNPHIEMTRFSFLFCVLSVILAVSFAAPSVSKAIGNANGEGLKAPKSVSTDPCYAACYTVVDCFGLCSYCAFVPKFGNTRCVPNVFP